MSLNKLSGHENYKGQSGFLKFGFQHWNSALVVRFTGMFVRELPADPVLHLIATLALPSLLLCLTLPVDLGPFQMQK